MDFKKLFSIGLLTLFAACSTSTPAPPPATSSAPLEAFLAPGESTVISCATAPACPVCLPACGDLTCNGTETFATCPGDCPAVCGDKICSGAELCSTCEGDCGFCPEPAVIAVAVPETTTNLVNPERGFYKGLNLITGATSAASHYASGHTLDLALVELAPYINGPIDQSFLDGLTNGFKILRTSGMKVVLRFRYSKSQTAPTDAPLATVLQHITQLAPIIKANSDVIAVVQAGFIGAWGEWHTSTNGLTTAANETTIINALLAAVPANRSIQIRTPMAKDAVFPGGALTAKSTTGKGRVGHHNDCFLASDSDMGTYASPSATWKAYVAQESKFTPVGGETCAVYPTLTDCTPAVQRMKDHHWSYLNEEYNKLVLDPWKTQGCYDAVQKSLGYYLSVTRLLMSKEVRPGGVIQLEFDVTNKGYASMFNSRPVYLALTRADQAKYRVLLPADAANWAPGVSTVKVKIRVPADVVSTVGDYQVSLWLPDAAVSLQSDEKYSVKLANPGNVLNSSFRITQSAGGAVDYNATTFAVIP